MRFVNGMSVPLGSEHVFKPTEETCIFHRIPRLRVVLKSIRSNTDATKMTCYRCTLAYSFPATAAENPKSAVLHPTSVVQVSLLLAIEARGSFEGPSPCNLVALLRQHPHQSPMLFAYFS